MTSRERWLLRRRIVFANRRGLTPEQIGAAEGLTPSSVRWILWREGERPNRVVSVPLLVEPKPHPALKVLRGSPVPLSVPVLAMALGNPEEYTRSFRRVQRALHRYQDVGAVRSWRSARHPRYTLWFPSDRTPMNLEAAQELLRRGVPFGDVFVDVAEIDRDVLKEWFCSTPELPNLVPRPYVPAVVIPSVREAHPKPEYTATGDFCRCGGLLVQTGNCKTCSWGCGYSSGGCS